MTRRVGRPRALDAYLDAAGRINTQAMSSALLSGQITLEEWQVGMANSIRMAHLASVTTAAGGFDRMGHVERGRVGGLVRAQLAHLRRFAEQIASGEQKLDGNISRRARLYTQMARDSYHVQMHAGLIDANPGEVVEVRSIVHPGDTCRGCIEMDGKWFPLGSPAYIRIGHRDCKANCRCDEEFRLASGGQLITPGQAFAA